MAFDGDMEEVVGILSRFYGGQLDALRDMYGEQAPMLAEEMGQMLGKNLIADTPYSQLWLEFTEDPAPNEAELIGVIEVIEETLPDLSIRLESYYAAFRQMQNQIEDIIENGEAEEGVIIEEIEMINSNDDGDDDDEYREDATYLTGNVEDRSTSAMYYDDLDPDIEPNESE